MAAVTTLQDCVDLVRRRLDNTEKPHLWLDAELIIYANEIQYIIAREVQPFIDSTTASTSTISLTLALGADYDISAFTYLIESVKLSSSSRLLTKTTKAEMDQSHHDWRNDDAAEPIRYLLDYQDGKITFWPKPDANYTASLTVIRYPTSDFSVTAMSGQTPTIPAYYRMALVYGICWQACMKSGEHTFDVNKATMYSALFRKQIADMKRDEVLFNSKPTTMGLRGAFT